MKSLPSFPERRVRMPRAVVTRAVDDALVLLHTGTGRYFTLDDVGARVWTVLTASPSLQHAYDTLLAEYQVSPEELRRDLEGLVDGLVELGLLEVEHG